MKRNHVFSVRNVAMMAALVAMQIILARFLSIQASDTLRVSFESIPVILAGMWLGPVSGALVALIADILGTIISGYGVWFPPIALGPVMVAVISGLSTKYIFKSDLTAARDTWKVLVTVIVAGILNSFVMGPSPQACTVSLSWATPRPLAPCWSITSASAWPPSP